MKTTTEYPYKLLMLDAAIQQATWYVNLIYMRSAAYSKTVWCEPHHIRSYYDSPTHLVYLTHLTFIQQGTYITH